MKPDQQAPARLQERVTLAHGSGGRAMHELISQVFVAGFDNPLLATLEDQARLPLAELGAHGDRLAMTTDSYVVSPLFFAGGDIGRLAVAGTVNDLAVGGARPLYLSCGMILEEGLELEVLRRVVASMRATADEAGVRIVTGDTKVVPRGSADGMFINTCGVGVIPAGVDLRAARAAPGDVIVVNGHIGDHGAAIVDARGELALESGVGSDSRPLAGLVQAMLRACPSMHCMRDATRGGVATVLNEFAQASGACMRLHEQALPIRDAVRGVCELLGLDPLYLANEGTLVALAPREDAETLLAAMRAHPAGHDAAIIGEVTQAPRASVLMHTRFGAQRAVDMLVGDQLPRIC